jgi:hypothetical protein
MAGFGGLPAPGRGSSIIGIVVTVEMSYPVETARRMEGEAPHGTEEVEAASSAAFLRASAASRGKRTRS